MEPRISATLKVRRIAAGLYDVTDGTAKVRVEKCDWLQGDWMAIADWDQHLYTDPLPTKRDAVYNAKSMLADRWQS